MTAQQAAPPTFGLYQRRIEGDDALMYLARLWFERAGIGAEMHSGSADALEAEFRFRPGSSPVIVHLPRDWSLRDAATRERIAGLATAFKGRVSGFVVHDEPELATSPEEFLHAALDMDSKLSSSGTSALVFLEYAVGLDPSMFAEFFQLIRALSRVSACIDVGHVGIREARNAFRRLHPGIDVCALRSQGPELPGWIADVQAASASALPAVLEMVTLCGQWGKPLHFHLHDGHPLSTYSAFGVSDHLDFRAEIPLKFEHNGKQSVRPMFGPEGLSRIVGHAMRVTGAGLASFTLEIHPTFERLSLSDGAEFFGHWSDKTNAERMNHWLQVLADNHELLRKAIAEAR